ncbi:MAG: ACP phosphodiesterase [Salinivirgaceae bacterium]|nr:ACP phosphodiesterase [Salinivirgaceae bacterium]
MNILAHLYLSGGFDERMLGNFMGDFVKGNQYTKYPTAMQEGIILHRNIDDATDKHPAHKSSRDRFRQHYGLHSGVVVDIVYDHFLANHWQHYHLSELEDFAQQAYQYIGSQTHWLPARLKEITPYIIQNNWLVMYKSLPGLEKVLNGMSRRTSLPNKAPFAMDIIDKEYVNLYSEFQDVFESLILTFNPTLNDTKK